MDHLLNHINDLHPTIKFTMEQEKEGSLPFLDTLLTRNKEGKMNISVCRKTTHTDRYLQYSSPSRICKKRDGLLFIPQCQDYSSRRKHTKGRTPPENGPENQRGYPGHVIQDAAKLRETKTTPEEQTKYMYTICLPYVAGIGEDLRRVCRKFNIRTIFTTTNTLSQQLTKVKDRGPTLKRSSLVYTCSIPCSCGQKCIGETNRNLEARLIEHLTATR